MVYQTLQVTSFEALVQSNQKFNLAAKRNMLLSLSGLMIVGLSAYFIPWENGSRTTTPKWVKLEKYR